MSDASIWAPGGAVLAASNNSIAVEQLSPTSTSQSLFLLTNFTYVVGTNSLHVYLNGVLQRNGTDYVETSESSFTWLAPAFVVGVDVITAEGLIEVISSPANPFGTMREVQVATAGQTSFTIASSVYVPNNGSLRAYINGLLQEPGDAYSEVSGAVLFTAGLAAEDEVTFQFNSEIGIGQEAAYVSYLPSGTGAVTTDVQSKLRESVSVSDYSTLQNALNTGLNVIIPFGITHNITSTVSFVSSNQSLIIDGTLKATSAMSSMLYSSNLNHISVLGNGIIDCNDLALSGIHFSTSQVSTKDISVKNISVKNITGVSSGFTGAIYFDSVGGKAGGNRHTNVTVSGVTVSTCSDHGILVSYSDGVTVSGNNISDIGFHGHESVNCTDILISQNRVKNCTQSGLGVGDNSKNFTISNNIINNCYGDGSITCEHNSVFGTINNNAIYNANTSGINISYGTAGSSPFDKIQNVVASNNVCYQKAGITNKLGINAYSTTGAGLGKGILITDNVLDGFNIGVNYSYMSFGSITNNTIRNLPSSGTSAAIVCKLVDNVDVSGNRSDSISSDHAIQILDYAGSSSTSCNISGNSVYSSGSGASKSLIYIEGNGSFSVVNNTTQGSSHHIQCSSTATVYSHNNFGPLSGSLYSGGTISSEIGTAHATSVGAAGGASALPATPLGYVSVYVNTLGSTVKIPYYTS